MTKTVDPAVAMLLKLLRRAHQDGECVLWDGKLSYGYGIFHTTGRFHRAHRLAWEIWHGQQAPPGAHVHHDCGNRRCIHPEHLRLLTPQQHKQHHPRPRKPRERKPRKPTIWELGVCTRGHDLTDPANVIARPSGLRCRECERERDRRRYADNTSRRERGLERLKQWKADNPERVKEQRRRRRQHLAP